VEFDKISWEDVDVAITEIAIWLQTRSHIKNIYGIPRGGLVLAVMLSHATNLPLTFKPNRYETLIVDDIADTGKTLAPYKDFTIVTLHYHKQSVVIPDLGLKEKKKAWIVYPWETECSTKP